MVPQNVMSSNCFKFKVPMLKFFVVVVVVVRMLLVMAEPPVVLGGAEVEQNLQTNPVSKHSCTVSQLKGTQADSVTATSLSATGVSFLLSGAGLVMTLLTVN